MRSFFAAIRPIRLLTLAFCATAFLHTSDLSAQNTDKFQLSPSKVDTLRRQVAQPNNTPENRGTSFSMNDLRGTQDTKIPSPDNESIPRSRRQLTPSQFQDSNTQQSTTTQNQDIAQGGRKFAQFNPDDFSLPPVQQESTGRPLQSSPDMSEFARPEVDSSLIRTVSANMQDTSNGSAAQSGFSANPLDRSRTQQSNLGAGSPISPTNGPSQFQTEQNLMQPSRMQGQPTNQQNFKSNSSFNSGQPTLQVPRNPTNQRLSNPAVNNQRVANNITPVVQSNLSSTPINPTRFNTSLAKNMIAKFGVENSTQPLPGQPMEMRQMLEITSPQNRPSMIGQYWTTYKAWCELISCNEYARLLDQISEPNNPAEKNLLSTARAIAANDLMASEIRLTKAQSRLQRFIPNSQDQLVLPLPSDMPLVTEYTTHFDHYASKRNMPNEIRNIATALPKMLTLISQQAETVQSSISTFGQVQRMVQGGRGPVGEAIQAAQLWRDANRGMVDSIIDYNRSIAAYSLHIMGINKPVEELAVALVGQTNRQAQASILQQPTARQATLPQEYQQQPQRGGNTLQPFTPRPGVNAQPAAMNQDRTGNPSSGFRIPNQGAQPGSFSSRPGSFSQ